MSEAPKTDKKDAQPSLLSFEAVQLRERALLARRRGSVGLAAEDGGPDQPAYRALTLSGGGIRSASFGLGVMQYLAKHDYLKRFDYFSTVSGGGYIGSSLSWLLQQKVKEPHSDEERFVFNTSEDGFPYSAVKRDVPPQENKTTERGAATADDGDELHSESKKYQYALIDRLRQRGSYLNPGAGITLFSLVSVLLRSIFLSLLVFVPLIIGVLYLWQMVGEFASWPYQLNLALVLCLLIMLAALVASLWYAVDSIRHNEKNSKRSYLFRRCFERYTGRLLLAFFALLALGLVSLLFSFSEEIKQLSIRGSALVGTAMSMFGIAASVLGYSGKQSKLGEQSKSLRRRFWPWLAAGSLLFGLVLLSYLAAKVILDSSHWGIPVVYLVTLLVGVGIGLFTNINYITLHRYYRDRLMEVFMPDLKSVIDQSDGVKGARKADDYPLACAEADRNPVAPLHLINANVVLADSLDRKYSGRGGDSFVMSSEFSGSEATGWCSTEHLAAGKLTLATAMANSGAAANPNTGVGGEGPMRNPAYSLLMSLLNIRLALWIDNPWFALEYKQGAKLDRVPTFLDPVLSCWLSWLKTSRRTRKDYRGGIPSFAQNERNKFIEISDGGHFENLALYELIRRRIKTVLVVAAGADPNYEFFDLANVIEKVRVDFGVTIKIEVHDLVPCEANKQHGIACSKSAVVCGEINYPDGQKGTLIYLKTVFIENLAPDLVGYKLANTSFPDQSTGDQFFDEKQFEAYRELGYSLARQLDHREESQKTPAELLFAR